MPGYTHLQPAQPTTFGHYLASVALALERDAERLLDVYPRLNLNPLGACAFAGTGFPIDRAMTAQWLGFDGIVDSTLDAVASRDYVSELLAAMAIMGVTLSRLAQDLYLWCSGEWGTVEVADDVAMTSSIMPQKKNPITLEHIKAKAGHLLGAVVASLAAQKAVNFMHCRDMGEAVAPLWDAFAQAQGVLHLTRRTVLGLQVNQSLMLERATQDFSTATELADVLVREKDLPFRMAHGIVSGVWWPGCCSRACPGVPSPVR
jgi:argininosuccinate lyase